MTTHQGGPRSPSLLAHAAPNRTHWSAGLSELSTSADLETAWRDVWRRWRHLSSLENEPDSAFQRRWVQQRMRLIYALRKRQQAQAALRLAQHGQAAWQFLPWLAAETLWSEPSPVELP